MKIQSVIATNFNGRDFQHDLTEINLIVGPNYSGKTAISNAIKVGLLGYLPRLGKQPNATLQLAGELRPEMSVTLVPDSCPAITHTWRRSGDKKYAVANPLAVPIVLLDTKDYFERTEADRIKFIFEKINPESYGYKDEDLLASLAKIEVLPAKVGIQATEELIGFVSKSIEQRKTNKISLQQWMDILLASLKVQFNQHSTVAEHLQSQMSTYGGYTRLIKPPDVTNELEAAQKQLRGLDEQIAVRKSQLDTWNKSTAKRTQIEEAIKLAPAINPDSYAKLESEVQSYASKTHGLNTKFAAEEARYKTLFAQSTKIKECLDEINEKLKKLLESDFCPYCKSTSQGWQATLEREFKSMFAALNLDLTNNEKAIDACKKTGAALKKQLIESKAEDQRFMEKTQEFKKLKIQVTQIDLLKKELEGINLNVPKPDMAELSKLVADQEKLTGEIYALQLKDQEFKKFEQQRKSYVEAETEFSKENCFAEVYKLARKKIIQMQETLTASAFNYILEKARALTDGILVAPLEYRNGELGMIQNGGWVSHSTFSGTEELLAYSGLSVALAQESPIKIVIMDELGRLEPARKQQLIKRIGELVKKQIIHQFIGVDVVSQDYAQFRGLNIIQLGA